MFDNVHNAAGTLLLVFAKGGSKGPQLGGEKRTSGPTRQLSA